MFGRLQQARRRFEVETIRLSLRARRDPRPLDRSRALGRLSDRPSVLFLCLGNICRSPMAERYLRTRLDAEGIDPSGVRSAGLLDRPGRPSPDPAVRTAAEFGVDLSDHRSRALTAEDLDRSDLVFVMDARNYRGLGRSFDGAREKAHFLGAFADGGFEIGDPYGGDEAGFRATYDRLSTAVDRFAEGLADRGTGGRT